jgi:hypothetical protein
LRWAATATKHGRPWRSPKDAILIRKPEDAQLHLRRARQSVQPGGPDWLHLQDLEQATERLQSISRG